jgi:butyrate kinase
LKGEVDAILLTGGIANNLRLMSQIEEMVKFIAPVKVYPGEDEMFALAENGYFVLTGKTKSMAYI